MIKRIAITGGIGSGKSYVCALLAKRGIDVFDCDESAKRLMRTSRRLQQQLSEAVGQEVFPDGVLDKALLSRYIVASEANAQRVDGIVHPAVAEDFMSSGKEWLESAILFESGFYVRVPFDYIVCVTAPLETRLQRVMARDNLSREKALAWINRQMPEEEKKRRADYVVVNDGKVDLEKQIDHVIKEIHNRT